MRPLPRRAVCTLLAGTPLLAQAAMAQGLPTDGIKPAAPSESPPGTVEWHDFDITGVGPSLKLRMQATPDGRTVTEEAFRGHVSMLYFGYTYCPDVCPLVLQNIVSVMSRLGAPAQKLRFLFVTVDPGRDTNKVLTDYTNAFGPQFVGLRGDANALDRLARRFRVAYSVTPSPDPELYQVSHSDSIYVFDRGLNARVLVPSLAKPDPDLDGVTRDLGRLLAEKPSRWDWLRRIV